MSTTYEPNDRTRVIRCGVSYANGDFDANVHAAGLIGDLHFALGLPEDPHVARHGGGDCHRAPYTATQSEAEAWAEKITAALHLFADDPNIELVIAWRDFLATCGGYTVQA